MFYPQTGYEGWSVFPDEEVQLALHQDCLEQMETTIKRLRKIVAQISMPEVERQTILYQLSHILQHLRESVNLLVADKRQKKN